MKQYFKIIILSCLTLSLFSCKKIRKLKEFDLNYTEEIVIPANSTLVSIPFELDTRETITNTSAEYKNEGTSAKLIESVVLTKLVFTIQSPSSGNYDFLNSVEIYLSSPNNTEVLIASKYNIPESGLTQLDMDVCETNLKNFLNDETYKLRVKTTTDKTLFSDMTIKADQTFHVRARLKNIFKR